MSERKRFDLRVFYLDGGQISYEDVTPTYEIDGCLTINWESGGKSRADVIPWSAIRKVTYEVYDEDDS